MKRWPLVVPVIVFGLGVFVSLRAEKEDDRLSAFGVTVALTTSVAALVGVFLTVRSKLGIARLDAQLLSVSAPPARLRLDPVAEAVLTLSRHDPLFSPARVTAHVEALYRAMQAASRDGQLALVHPWVSDGLFQRLSTQARLLGEVVGRELLAGHALQSAVICGAGVGETYQSLSVRVTVTPLDEGKRLEAQTQVWSFLRRLSATTHAHGLFEGRCPQCCAPLELSATQRCAHCQAVVNSGHHDWVLCDVAPGATTLTRKGELLDVDGLRAKDATLSPEELTDRALLAFWRWYEAAASGDARRLARVSTDALRAQLAPEFATRALAGSRITVGGAELRLLQLAGDLERAAVVVWWSKGDGDAQQTVLHLVRPVVRPAAATSTGLASCRCEGCLAPMTDTEAPACEHCGRPFTDAWRLDALEPFSTWSDAVRVLRRQLGTRSWQTVPRHERVRALQLAASVAKADGRVADAERSILERLARTWDLGADAVDEALRVEGPSGAAGLALPREFARELVRQLVEVVFVDGRAELPERKQVERLAASLGVQDEANKLIAQRVDALMKQLMR